MGLPEQRRWSYGRLFASTKWQYLLRYVVIAFVLSTSLVGILLLGRREGFLSDTLDRFNPLRTKPTPHQPHPIEKLISEAQASHDKLLAERSLSLDISARRYRARRGRHPPPGFDAWFEYAAQHDAIVVESFFDRIYHDLAPFWGLDPQLTAERATSWEHVVRVRNGRAWPQGDIGNRVGWLPLWTDLVAEAAEHLPDVDMPINYMDEPRILVSWENITELVGREQANRTLTEPSAVLRSFSGLAALDKKNVTKPYQPQWIRTQNYWDVARAACAPDSLSRDVEHLQNVVRPPTFAAHWNARYTYKGYVQNFTSARDPCIQPHLRGMHATFIEPLTMATSTELIPMFGGSKLPINNEILIPGAMYLTEDPFYSGGAKHGPRWPEKLNGTVWRGVASGGRNHKENWTGFQRHRLIQMLNGTTVADMEANGTQAPTFELPSASMYDFPRRREGKVGTWLQSFADAGFRELLCFPKDECDYVLPYLSVVDGIPMVEQYNYKYVPDVDGNSFSARFRGFMLSTSLPLKATVYSEWHDDRLTPWVHFAPMDNTFQDMYSILDFFTRDAEGDEAARLIAEQGQAWAAKVLRREDMVLYVWRLLLEFARVCDVNRDSLGFVGDLDVKE